MNVSDIDQLPPEFVHANDEKIAEMISLAKSKLKDRCVILGHHYQRPDVIKHADYIGDSLKLAQFARQETKAEMIVYCGVHFMAETADMLTRPDQLVSLPDMRAGCDMADMADVSDVIQAYTDLDHLGFSNVIPITYINSTAALKSLVGKKGGAICTSSNAENIIRWAAKSSQENGHIFFFPDQHLGRNVSKAIGYHPDRDMILWDPDKYLGGHTPERLREAKIWLWKGHCPVHALFSVQQIDKWRVEDPEMKIIVHPECAMEVVDRADLVGSTDFIVRTIAAAPSGTSFAVGTEKHLVERLASTYPDKKIVSLNRFSCLCGTMNRISPRHLARVLTEVVEGKPLRNVVKVEKAVSLDALSALERMFALS